jgi:membrane protein required for colicin V production
MNSFDAAVFAFLAVAVVTGFQAGFLRSVATIVAYVCAMPLAVAIAPLVAPAFAGTAGARGTQDSFLLFGLFLTGGIVLGGLFRLTISELVGPSVHVTDRLAGAMLGAARVGLVAVTTVLVFDQLIPAGREPAFLQGSRLRPILSSAAKAGLRSLPPDAAELIDRLKRQQRS